MESTLMAFHQWFLLENSSLDLVFRFHEQVRKTTQKCPLTSDKNSEKVTLQILSKRWFNRHLLQFVYYQPCKFQGFAKTRNLVILVSDIEIWQFVLRRLKRRLPNTSCSFWETSEVRLRLKRFFGHNFWLEPRRTFSGFIWSQWKFGPSHFGSGGTYCPRGRQTGMPSSKADFSPKAKLEGFCYRPKGEVNFSC